MKLIPINLILFCGLILGLASCASDGVAGPAGPQGETGDKGTTGERGDTGEDGDAGERGDKGETGDAGPAGPQGDKGEQGDGGEKGPTGLAGPQGDPGKQGDKGERGDKGETGDTGQRGQQPLACRAGDYDTTGDGVWEWTISCYASGSRQCLTVYTSLLGHALDGTTKDYELCYYEANGKLKTNTAYHPTGTIKDFKCYATDGTTAEPCEPPTHGTPSPLIVYDSNGKKRYERTYWPNGKWKTYVEYHYDSLRKSREESYWESGNRKTYIAYKTNGLKLSSTPNPLCNNETTGAQETCTVARHGCDSSSTTCIPSE